MAGSSRFRKDNILNLNLSTEPILALGVYFSYFDKLAARKNRLLSRAVTFVGNSGFILTIIFAATRVSKILSPSPPVNPFFS